MWSWIDDHRHQAVDRDRAGVVGDDQRAALGRDVLDAADLDPEPLLGDRPQRGHEEALGDLRVEAVLVDDVVAGQPAAQERQELGELGLPLVAEDLLGGVLERRQPVAGRDAGPRVPLVAWCGRALARRVASALGRRGRGGSRRRLGVGLRPASAARRSTAVGGSASFGRASAASVFARPGRQAAGRPTTACCAGAAAGAAAGADRDDLGVTHRGTSAGRRWASAVRRAAVGQRAEHAARRGRRSASATAANSANASAVV